MVPSSFINHISLLCYNEFFLSSLGLVQNSGKKDSAQQLCIWANRSNRHFSYSLTSEVWWCPVFLFCVLKQSLIMWPGPAWNSVLLLLLPTECWGHRYELGCFYGAFSNASCGPPIGSFSDWKPFSVPGVSFLKIPRISKFFIWHPTTGYLWGCSLKVITTASTRDKGLSCDRGVEVIQWRSMVERKLPGKDLSVFWSHESPFVISFR